MIYIRAHYGVRRDLRWFAGITGVFTDAECAELGPSRRLFHRPRDVPSAAQTPHDEDLDEDVDGGPESNRTPTRDRPRRPPIPSPVGGSRPRCRLGPRCRRCTRLFRECIRWRRRRLGMGLSAAKRRMRHWIGQGSVLGRASVESASRPDLFRSGASARAPDHRYFFGKGGGWLEFLRPVGFGLGVAGAGLMAYNRHF